MALHERVYIVIVTYWEWRWQLEYCDLKVNSNHAGSRILKFDFVWIDRGLV